MNSKRKQHVKTTPGTLDYKQIPHLSVWLTRVRPVVTTKQKHGMLYIPEEMLSRIIISANFLFISEGTN